nr:hypothetical protein HUO10_001276 [Paraburkholderia busanensis]
MATERRNEIRCGAPSTVSGSGEPAGLAGGVDWRVTQRSDDQARLNTSVPFVPPNPNEFFSATSIFISRAVLAQ